jgi:hypothetical protein
LAEVIAEPRPHEKFSSLVKRAQELIKAESVWMDMPNLASPEAVKVSEAIDVFLKEFENCLSVTALAS